LDVDLIKMIRLSVWLLAVAVVFTLAIADSGSQNTDNLNTQQLAQDDSLQSRILREAKDEKKKKFKLRGRNNKRQNQNSKLNKKKNSGIFKKGAKNKGDKLQNNKAKRMRNKKDDKPKKKDKDGKMKKRKGKKNKPVNNKKVERQKARKNERKKDNKGKKDVKKKKKKLQRKKKFQKERSKKKGKKSLRKKNNKESGNSDRKRNRKERKQQIRKKDKKEKKKDKKKDRKRKNNKEKGNKNKDRKRKNKANPGARQSDGTCTKSEVSVECIESAVEVMSFLQKQVTYFINQYQRIKSFNKTINGKLGKNEAFVNASKYVLSSLGGDIGNASCGDTGTKNVTEAAVGVTMYTELNNCSAAIKDQCSMPTDMIPDDVMDLFENFCMVQFKDAKAKAEECRTDDKYTTDGAAACECWNNVATILKNTKESGDCSAVQYAKAIKKFKNDCVSTFSSCRKQEDAAVQLVYTCGDGEIEEDPSKSSRFVS